MLKEKETSVSFHPIKHDTGNIRIEIDGCGHGHFYIDDHEIPNVLGYSISHRALEKPVVHIDVFAWSLTYNACYTLPKLPAPWDEYFEPREEFRDAAPKGGEA